jgi:SAM-dependent methyltransferase
LSLSSTSSASRHPASQARSGPDEEDFEFLLSNARAGKALGLSHFVHLDQPIGIHNYIRIANDIASSVPAGRMLDWGCGFGQMTYLMRRRGFEVTPFDLGEPGKQMPDIPLCRDLNIVRTTHPTNLPFEARQFDAVLSCGVLEHVDEFSEPGNEIKSLQEIARVLRPGGRLLIYQLPQEYAWQEAITRRLEIGYAHARRYTLPEIAAILARSGYSIQRVTRSGLVPKNLTGLPEGVRNLYSRFSQVLLALDRLLCRVPGLNALAGVMEITARYDGHG